MEVTIIGGGITGLALALNLHKRGIPSRVYESAPEIKELGVGITLLPHAMRELMALGFLEDLASIAIQNRESLYFNRFGQLIYKEARGKFAGYRYPELGIHRGRLHTVMYKAAVEQLGNDRIVTNRTCIGFEQHSQGVDLQFRNSRTGATAENVRAEIVIGCDGINSAVRKGFYPEERLAFSGINTWRGISRHAPILGGRSYIRIGSIRTGKLVIYPIIEAVDGGGEQLINWMAEIEKALGEKNDWNKAGSLGDFLPIYKDWRFDWLDVPEMLRSSDMILEYPMVDKDPVEHWTFGRVSLAGDAAHPMYPRGSNGAAQGLIDSRILAELLYKNANPVEALAAYEQVRLPATSTIVRTNRSHPPDYINVRVEELTGDQPFDRLDKFISQAELSNLSERYKRIAGFSNTDLL